METGGRKVTQETIQHEAWLVVATWRIPRNGHSLQNRQSYNRLATSKDRIIMHGHNYASMHNSLISAVGHRFDSSPSYSLLNTEVVFQKLVHILHVLLIFVLHIHTTTPTRNICMPPPLQKKEEASFSQPRLPM